MNELNYNFTLSVQNDDLNSGTSSSTPLVVELTFAKVLKGDPFTYADFTPQQIAELQKPATDAKSEVDVALAALATKEAQFEQNETSRNNKVDSAVAGLDEIRALALNAVQVANTASGFALDSATEADHATANAMIATDEAKRAAVRADEASNTPYINETTMTWWKYNKNRGVYEDSRILATSSPYATFEIDLNTMELKMTTDPYYGGVTFSMQGNELVFTI